MVDWPTIGQDPWGEDFLAAAAALEAQQIAGDEALQVQIDAVEAGDVDSVAGLTGTVSASDLKTALSLPSNTISDLAVEAATRELHDLLLGWVNVKHPDYGAVGDNATDDTAAITAAIDALPENGGTLYFPPGIYLADTPTADVILSITDRPDLTVRGCGLASNIRTSSATATELLRVQDCTGFSLRDLTFSVTGTAQIEKAVHYTVSSPGSAHVLDVDHVYIDNPSSVYRRVFDVMTVSASSTIYSGMAAFDSGDVGARVTLAYLDDWFVTNIASVQTFSTTLSAGIDDSTTTIPLTAALNGGSMPPSGWSVKIGTEHMLVTGGGNTNSLTVLRGRGNDVIYGAHSSGAAVTVYKAVLDDAPDFSTSEADAMLRIETSAAHMDHGFAIGLDHPGASNLDIANSTLKALSVAHACAGGLSVGNGTSGNILDQWAYGLSIGQCGIGVLTDGGSVSVHGGDMGYNLVDFFRKQPTSQEVKIDGIRSEHCGMFYQHAGGTAGVGVTLSNIVLATIHTENHVFIRHTAVPALLLENITAVAASVAADPGMYIVALGTDSLHPCQVTAINVATATPAASVFVNDVRNTLVILNEQHIYNDGTHNPVASPIVLEGFSASGVTNVPAGGIAATTVQAAIDELDSEKQPADSDLTAIAALDSSTSGAIASDGAGWIKKTYAQFKTALGLVKGDVGLGNVDNTSDANKPVSTATQTALDGKQSLDSDLTTIAGLTATTDNFLQAKSSAWASRTPAQVKTDLSLPTDTVTELSNKQPLDSDLTTIAGLTATTDNIIQSVGSAWASRTPTQVKTALSLNNVDNTSDATKFTNTALTGTPTAPTATAGTNTTQVATTAFVRANVQPYCLLEASGATSIGAATDTKVTLATTVNADSGFSVSSSVITVSAAGLYDISAACGMDTGAYELVYFYVFKNGLPGAGGTAVAIASVDSNQLITDFGRLGVSLAANDTLQLAAYQASGTSNTYHNATYLKARLLVRKVG